MSRRKANSADPCQGNFGFFLEPVAVPAPEAPAEDFDRAMREAVAATLDDAARRNTAPLRREAVAEAMSSLLGRRVSKTQLDQWAAPSQEDRRIPADAVRALGLVTDDWRALHVLVEACGFKALTPEEAICAEFGALAAVRRRIDQRSRELTGDMEALVAGLIGKMKQGAAQ